MKALKITTTESIEVVNINKPEMGDSDVMIRVKYVGFCGSDLNTFLGRNPMVKLPIIPGHEVGGIIEAVGKSVPAEFHVGMHITVNPYTNCGKCASCRVGRVNACEFNQTFGVQRDGAMSEYLCLPWSKVISAGNLSPQDSALIEPMSVGFHAVSRAQVTDNDTVLVIGCGMIGMGAIVRSALRGATVIAMDIDDKKLELAKRIGARHTINSKTEQVHERMIELCKGLGADVVIEAVGTPATYVMAIDEVAFSGRVVCIGYAKNEVAFQTKYFVQKELDIRGSRNALPEDFRAVVNYLNQGNAPLKEFVTNVVTPENAADAMRTWASDPGKVFRILVEF